MAYFTLSYFEIASILEIIIWSILRRRIQQKLDGPPAVAVPVSPQMVDPYGRQVVVVQPGDIVMMQGNPYQYNPYPYEQNQPQTPVSNAQFPVSNDFQIQEKIS